MGDTIALGDRICELAAHLNAASCRLLELIAQFDLHTGWGAEGCNSCAHWLNWKCGIGLNAAREKVRVAHALKTLTLIATAFASGELSYSKVRAMTRVVGTHSEDELLSFALQTTTARVEERCRELKCGTAESLEGAQRAYANRSLRVNRNAERGMIVAGGARNSQAPGSRGKQCEGADAHDRERKHGLNQGERVPNSEWGVGNVE